jgi:3-phosphoshikimate 1-carboxyvinyltransferase
MDYRIFPPEELIEDGVVTLPLSKSIQNREMILAALTPGGVPADYAGTADGDAAPSADCVDVVVMRGALEEIAASDPGEIVVRAGESGTALRFLCAYLAVQEGYEAVLTGEPGLLKRPVRGLVNSLRQLGASIDYIGQEGYAPLRIRGRRLAGGEVEVDATTSSQFVSALMMIAPTMEQGLTIRFDGEPVSVPYIKMTASLMARWGVEVEQTPMSITVPTGCYRVAEPLAEGDWSGAAFWYEVVALTAGWVSLKPLLSPSESVQGDAATARLFECLGVLTEPSEDIPGAVSLSPSPEVFGRLDLNLSDNPDLVPALAVTCCMLGVPFKFDGLKTLGIKESDRLQAVTVEMQKIGCMVEKIRDYGLEWDGRRKPILEMPVFDSHGDHRLAMAFAPVSAYVPGIVVRDVECVDKSYPGYWDSLRALGFQTLDPSQPVDGLSGSDEAETLSDSSEKEVEE